MGHLSPKTAIELGEKIIHLYFLAQSKTVSNPMLLTVLHNNGFNSPIEDNIAAMLMITFIFYSYITFSIFAALVISRIKNFPICFLGNLGFVISEIITFYFPYFWYKIGISAVPICPLHPVRSTFFTKVEKYFF